MKPLLLSLLVLISSSAFANFDEVLEQFPDLPNSLTDAQIQKLAQSGFDVHYYFNEHGLTRTTDELTPIAKLPTRYGYFLLVSDGEQINKNGLPYLNIHGYSVDKKGNLKERMLYILTSGDFNAQREIASFWREGKEFHFYTETYDRAERKSTYADKVYRLRRRNMDYQHTNRNKQAHQ